MKYLLLIGLFFITNSVCANTIDSLKTEIEIGNFIHKLFKQKYPDSYDNKFYSFSVVRPDSLFYKIECDSVISSWKLKNWQKIDLNADGLTDLFAVIYIKNINDSGSSFKICAIIDNGNNSFNLTEIPNYYTPYCYAAVPIFINNEALILFRHHKIEISEEFRPDVTIIDSSKYYYYDIVKTDTLIYKFGGFIERNSINFERKIKSIYFETTPCFGKCDVFKLNIFADGTAYYINETIGETGNFRTTLKTKDLNTITGLINYMNTFKMESHYDINSTDMQTANLKVFYADGLTKEINDYGMQGTSCLVRLYKILSELRKNQDWK